MVCRNRRALDYEGEMIYRAGMQLIKQKKKKQYTPPKLNKLPLDKAKEVLLDQAACGNQEAKDLLSLLRQTSA
jgi:hypothetical protein